MRFKISEYIKTELNKISFLLKLSHYKSILPPRGPVMKMIDDSPVDWEDVTTINIKNNPREVSKNDIEGNYPDISTKTGPSIFDSEFDTFNRISFELYGKLKDSKHPIKIRVERGVNMDDSYYYSIFLKDDKNDYKLITKPSNAKECLKELNELNTFVKESISGDIDSSGLVDTTSELLNSFQDLIKGSKNKEIMSFILEEYEKREKEKPLYLFKLKPDKQLRDKFINLNFELDSDIKNDSKKRNSDYEKKISDILLDYINKNLSDKIDLDKFIFSYKQGTSFGIKVKIK